MIIRINDYSNTHRAVEVVFTPETNEDKALLGALATNAAKFGERERNGVLRLRGKVS